MSGLLGAAELFASVADGWDRALRAQHPGAIRYFKMEEATGLKGEFAHWREEPRDEKIRQMAQVINRRDLLEVAAVVNLKDFAKAESEWSHVGHRHTMNQPHLTLFQYVMVSCVSEALNHGSFEPMEVVFDDNAVFRGEIQRMYPLVREVESEDPERLAVLPVQPWFRDDRDFVVLQAADLLAGRLRLNLESPGPVVDLCPDLRVSRYFRVLEMQDASEHLIRLERDMLLRHYPED